MQKTRQQILEYLMANGEATVEELSTALGNLTAVTVRHHLDVLRSEGLVGTPEIEHRNSPGRPRYIYRLTEKAGAFYPRNVETLTRHMFDELKSTLNPQEFNLIFDRVAERMAADFDPAPSDETFEQRIERVVAHLSRQGYEARWELHPEGYLLCTSNCPYHSVVKSHEELCTLDLRYLEHLLGTSPRRLEHLLEGGSTCTFLVPVLHETS